MKKDYKKILKDLYLPKPYKPHIVDVPKTNYLMVGGQGHPDEEKFKLAAATIFPAAYVAKFILKAKLPKEDFVVMPMEVKYKLDRSQNGSKRFHWTIMVMQPDAINEDIINEAIYALKAKKRDLPYENRLRYQAYTENKCGQILHIGPFRGPMEKTFDILKQYLASQGYEWEPDSHDVYFNDTRRTPEEKLKTLIRVRIWKKDKPMPSLEDPFAI